MTTEDAAHTVRCSITVPVAPEKAFALFTAGHDSWYPRADHNVGGPLAAAVLEPRLGGRWYERGIDGSEIDWGRVTALEPPLTLSLDWQLGADWTYQPDLHTRVQVSLTPTRDGGTSVAIEHYDLDHYGPDEDTMREAFGGANGWPHILQCFATAGRDRDAQMRANVGSR